MKNCYFCKCVEEKNIVLENKLAFALFDGYPVNEGHMLIIPKRHIKDWWETTYAERKDILSLVDQAKEYLDKKYKPDGYNIGMNLGESAGQSIMHLHVHLIPRYVGDTPNPRGGVRGVIPEKQNY